MNVPFTFEDARAAVSRFRVAKSVSEVADELALKREMASGAVVKRSAERNNRIWEVR